MKTLKLISEKIEKVYDKISFFIFEGKSLGIQKNNFGI